MFAIVLIMEFQLITISDNAREWLQNRDATQNQVVGGDFSPFSLLFCSLRRILSFLYTHKPGQQYSHCAENEPDLRTYSIGIINKNTRCQ